MVRTVNIGPLFEAFPLCEDYIQDVQRLLTADGVIARRDHPELDSTLRYLVRRGDLARVLPGIYTAADQAASLQTRVRALSSIVADPRPGT